MTNIEPYLSVEIFESNHYFCPNDRCWENRFLLFKKSNNGSDTWEPCPESEAEIGLELCKECLNAKKLHDGYVYAKRYLLDGLNDEQITEKYKHFKKFLVLWEKCDDGWRGIDESLEAHIRQELRPVLKHLGVKA
ncbi:MAG TPA: hypothetical protein VKM55_01765 [Candidatus Lokiarchaeia archaeon]|nr:hypothetical protein [Candidatus Lokiarchaeia archaeon]